MSGKRKLVSGTARNDALQALLAAKEKGVKNKYDDADSDEDRVFDQVDEDTYRNIQTKRLRDDFIVDDDGLGYADHGHEETWDEDEEASEDDAEGDRRLLKNRKKIRKAGGAGPSAPPSKKQAGDLERYMRMNPSSKIGKTLLRSSQPLTGLLPPHGAAALGGQQSADDILLSFDDAMMATTPPTSGRSTTTAATASQGSRKAAMRTTNNHLALMNSGGGSAGPAYTPSFEQHQQQPHHLSFGVSSADLDDLDDVLNTPITAIAGSTNNNNNNNKMVKEAEVSAASLMMDEALANGTAVLDDADKAQAELDRQAKTEAEALAQQRAFEAAEFGVDAVAGLSRAAPSSSLLSSSTSSSSSALAAAAKKKGKRIITSAPKAVAPGPAPASATDAPQSEPISGLNDDWFEVQTDRAAQDKMNGVSITTEPGTGTGTGEGPVMQLNDYAEDGKFIFFWLDAWEEKGVVYLFGKTQNIATKRYDSCCVQLLNIDRQMFVLPRPYHLSSASINDAQPTDQPVTMADVQAELGEIMQRAKVAAWRSKAVSRKYAFELSDVPPVADYLHVMTPFKAPALASDLQGKTFSRVFGTQTSAMETVILKYNLMGPCWLAIDGATLLPSPVSWCTFDLQLDLKAHPKGIAHFTESAGGGGSGSDGATTPRPAPPLTVMSLSIKTMLGANKLNEIVACSMLVYQNVQCDGPTSATDQKPAQRFTAVRQLIGMPWPSGFQESIKQHQLPVQLFPAEMGMLNWLTAIMKRVDADVLLGHNILGFELEVLLQRMKALKVKPWSRLGRLRRENFPALKSQKGFGESTHASRLVASGRLVCDTYLSAKEHVRSKSYSLSTLVETLLKIKRTEVDYDKTDLYYAQGRDLLYFVQHTEKDAYLATALAFNLMIMPLSKQITNLAGNLWARTLTGGRAERNEFLLLHEFHKSDYIVPDKEFASSLSNSNKGKNGSGGKGKSQTASSTARAREGGGGGDGEEMNENDNEMAEQALEAASQPTKSGRRKPAYAGGLVLEPKKGLYDKYVLLLDFNSLYPSIIQEYNICFTTVDRRYGDKDENGEEVLPDVPDANLEYGILPRLLGTLVERRRAVKALLKKASGNEYAQLDLRQKALKLTANSMYGCLGFTHSRFYAKPLAVLITLKGREILQNTVDLAEKSLNLNVIYGDTDSIMINTATEDLAKVKEMGRALKQEVNKKYKKLEIEMDGYFKRMLLLKKKKYAALLATEQPDGSITTSPEYKGLDLVRRDWCALSHDVSNYALDQILSGLPKDEVVANLQTFLRQVGIDTREGKIPLEKFIINKGLTKQPHEYPDAKNQPHVQVALRLRSKGRGLQAGDTIQYIICTTSSAGGLDGSPAVSEKDEKKDGGGIAARAFHPDEIKRPNSGLTVDYEYYLQNQIHPPVDRLCQPIEGMDSVLLAEFLGLDAAKFKHTIAQVADEEEVLTSFATILTDEERYKDAERWQMICQSCKKEQAFQGLLRKQGKAYESGLTCEACHASFDVKIMARQLQRTIHRQLRRFHEFWLACEECRGRTRDASVHSDHCLTPGCNGRYRMEFSNTQLFNQLSYYRWLVDSETWLRRHGQHDPSSMEVMTPSSRPRDAEPAFSDDAILLVRQEEARFQPLRACVEQFSNQMARSWVNLGPLFTYGRNALAAK